MQNINLHRWKACPIRFQNRGICVMTRLQYTSVWNILIYFARKINKEQYNKVHWCPILILLQNFITNIFTHKIERLFMVNIHIPSAFALFALSHNVNPPLYLSFLQFILFLIHFKESCRHQYISPQMFQHAIAELKICLSYLK